ncbi:hypothetical protein SAMN06298226_1596 [Nitrosovibrio sp. Nv4]|nr:hypothetical protein SAMN06298226_1596 [Nitrosovibrio sp. Nv4]
MLSSRCIPEPKLITVILLKPAAVNSFRTAAKHLSLRIVSLEIGLYENLKTLAKTIRTSHPVTEKSRIDEICCRYHSHTFIFQHNHKDTIDKEGQETRHRDLLQLATQGNQLIFPIIGVPGSQPYRRRHSEKYFFRCIASCF